MAGCQRSRIRLTGGGGANVQFFKPLINSIDETN